MLINTINRTMNYSEISAKLNNYVTLHLQQSVIYATILN